MSANPELYTLPISARPPTSWRQTFKSIAFMVLWLFASLMINGSQFVFLLPIRLLPFRWARSLYYEGIRWTKGCCGCLLSAWRWTVLLCQMLMTCTICSLDVSMVCANQAANYLWNARPWKVQPRGDETCCREEYTRPDRQPKPTN